MFYRQIQPCIKEYHLSENFSSKSWLTHKSTIQKIILVSHFENFGYFLRNTIMVEEIGNFSFLGVLHLVILNLFVFQSIVSKCLKIWRKNFYRGILKNIEVRRFLEYFKNSRILNINLIYVRTY